MRSKNLCVNPEDGDRIVEYVKDLYNRGVAVGADVRGSQMTAGNVAGGLTTLIEKSDGCKRKRTKSSDTGHNRLRQQTKTA